MQEFKKQTKYFWRVWVEEEYSNEDEHTYFFASEKVATEWIKSVFKRRGIDFNRVKEENCISIYLDKDGITFIEEME